MPPGEAKAEPKVGEDHAGWTPANGFGEVGLNETICEHVRMPYTDP